MKKSTRALVGFVILEFLLFSATAVTLLMLRLGIWVSPNPAEAFRTIASIAGGAMGIVGAVLLLAFFNHRKNGN